MKCPHCLNAIFANSSAYFIGEDSEGNWFTNSFLCPACGRWVIHIVNAVQVIVSNGNVQFKEPKYTRLVHPKGISRQRPPPEVPTHLAEDYLEACAVIDDSAKASAALSRRCLQHLLREVGFKPGDLANEIQQALDSGKLPTHIAEAIDAVRNVGNFSAHPMKSKVTGDIMPVESGEAEWNLDTLESLFDFFFVQPAKSKARRDALNAKLIEAGKPPLK